MLARSFMPRARAHRGLVWGRLAVGLGSCAVALALGASARANPTSAEHVQVALVAERPSATPGEPLRVGLRFVLERGWHVYWRNPGDSGQAPSLAWELPAGISAGAIEWPAPHRFTAGPLVNYGYEREVLLPVRLDVGGNVAAGRAVRITAQARWLVCSEECIPGRATLALDLPVEVADRAAAPNPAFARVDAELPTAVAATAEDHGATFDVVVPLSTPTPDAAEVHFFPQEPLLIDEAKPQRWERAPSGLRVAVPKAQDAPPTHRLAGVVVVEASQDRRAFAVDAAVRPASAAPTPVERDAAAPWWRALLFAVPLAFLGGVILNLMPCVFPVLSLKVLGFMHHTAPGEARRQSWAYALGVVASFWALAGLLLALRAGSARLGWGFQLQSPGFVVALAVLMFAVALNLAGVFEVGLSLTRLGGAAPGSSGIAGSFATGVLATLVATPCTAPFMGSALGFAITQPAPVALAIFSALGLGMAAPYVALAHAPALLRRLPRPGAWMELLRQALAFPMLATVLWLVMVLHDLAGPLATFRLLAALLGAAATGWAYGRWQRSARRPAIGLAITAAALVAVVVVGAGATSSGAPAAQASGLWQPWSPARVAELRAAGKPVFVNFTAAWCISCQVNERLVFSRSEVQDTFARQGVVALKADWTNRDEVITTALESHGRVGVPLYLYYAGNSPSGAGPEVLPALLTPRTVIEAVTR